MFVCCVYSDSTVPPLPSNISSKKKEKDKHKSKKKAETHQSNLDRQKLQIAQGHIEMIPIEHEAEKRTIFKMKGFGKEEGLPNMFEKVPASSVNVLEDQLPNVNKDIRDGTKDIATVAQQGYDQTLLHCEDLNAAAQHGYHCSLEDWLLGYLRFPVESIPENLEMHSKYAGHAIAQDHPSHLLRAHNHAVTYVFYLLLVCFDEFECVGMFFDWVWM